MQREERVFGSPEDFYASFAEEKSCRRIRGEEKFSQNDVQSGEGDPEQMFESRCKREPNKFGAQLPARQIALPSHKTQMKLRLHFWRQQDKNKSCGTNSQRGKKHSALGSGPYRTEKELILHATGQSSSKKSVSGRIGELRRSRNKPERRTGERTKTEKQNELRLKDRTTTNSNVRLDEIRRRPWRVGTKGVSTNCWTEA